MKIAIAQIGPTKGEINLNIQKHIELIHQAASKGANAIFFPELSITGYEPTLANKLKMEVFDPRLDIFQEISDLHKLTIGIGVPTAFVKDAQISLVIFQPNELRIKYAKQILHEDEWPFFVKGEEQSIINVEGVKIAPAICFESMQPIHLESAKRKGAHCYVVCAAKSFQGMEKAIPYYSKMAQKHSIPILISNGVGPCDNFISNGRSSIWNNQGVLMSDLSNSEEGILVVEINDL